MRKIVTTLTLLLAGFAFIAGPFTSGGTVSATQAAQTYVLYAGNWGGDQANAVTRAGGSVTFSHRKGGVGVITSSAPDFLERALASGVFSGGAADRVVQWQKPVREFEFNESIVTPGDETFINLQWNVQSVKAPAAWAAGFTGQGVRVAVLDGGIHSTHQDLDANLDLVRSASFVPGQPFNNDTGTFWHGTHVAGIIAAEDNALGTIGVAPNATIIGVKVLHSGSGAFSWVIQGILYAATPISEGGAGAEIINMSLGAVFPRSDPGAGELISALNKAVNYAMRHNVLVVSSAGNDAIDFDHSGDLITVPADSGSGLAVSATGPEGYAVNYPNGATNFRRQASYTNFGNSLIWVAAPGGDFALPGNAVCSVPRTVGAPVVNLCWVFDMVLSTSRGAGASTTSYSFAAGTSMAAPAAAGVAALIKQRTPGISVGALKNKLANTADDEGAVGHDPIYGRGFVNAHRAVTE